MLPTGRPPIVREDVQPILQRHVRARVVGPSRPQAQARELVRAGREIWAALQQHLGGLLQALHGGRHSKLASRVARLGSERDRISDLPVRPGAQRQASRAEPAIERVHPK